MATRIGVLVPCHNEAAVIERKLANLAACDWPAASGPHRVVIVDDGSTDDTAAVAQATCEQLFGERVRACVVANGQRPGKPGAIEQGLEQLAGEVDLVCLTDADVVFEPAALALVAAAFARDPQLAMASGEQRFVESLAHDGTCLTPGGRGLENIGGMYDRCTALVRGWESRHGMLFSVHGQLLVWRAELGLQPTPGFAADDLDLMLQARGSDEGRGRIVQVPGARFYEVRAPAGAGRDAQALRRARAYVQFLKHPRVAELSERGGLSRRMQGAFYRRIPTAAPVLAVIGMQLSLVLAVFLGGLEAATVAALAWGALALSPPGRRCMLLMRVIASAVHSQSEGDLGDRWETARH